MSFGAAARVLFLGGSLIFASAVIASEPFEIPLWDGTVPGSEDAVAVVETSEERGDADHPDRKIRGVTNPSITIHLPESQNNTGTAILILPGGGYTGLAIDKEGHDIARYLNTIGVTGVVMKYRLPRPRGFGFQHDVPLRDAARGIRMIRHQAEKWGVNTGRVGVMGFSAGGHLAATVATQHKRATGEPTDPVNQQSARPDFQVLVYPVTSFRDSVGHGGSRKNLIGDDPDSGLIDLYSNETQVTPDTPPAFLVHTVDDRVKVENSLVYFQALRAADVPVELHVYEVGGHGYGIRETGLPVATWHHRMAEWLQQRGLLEP